MGGDGDLASSTQAAAMSNGKRRDQRIRIRQEIVGARHMST
jgi:hypothetical protein